MTRRALAVSVLCAMLLTQALGLLHRIVHVHGPAHLPLVHAGAERDPHGLARLFTQHHDAADCQALDQLSQTHAPGFGAWDVPSTQALPEWRAQHMSVPQLAERTASHLPRGPPTRA